ncbi:MAG: ADP-ribosylglycohydrolase family protein [Cyanobacteria bacterium P01_D01_bin.50]
MRHSLTSRVRGTLLGGLLGQNLVATEAVESDNCSFGVFQSMESLIAQGGFDLNQWNQLDPWQYNQEISCNLMLAKVILATLPIALFFHDNKIKLRENLLLAIKNNDNPNIRDGVLAVCYLIAQSLSEKINPNTLVSEITYFISDTTTEIPIKLQQVNNLIVENAGLAELQNYLGKGNSISNTIAVAFYSFANTKEDFSLTCLQAIQNTHDSQVCGAIAGAISGAYNSMAGIPITWHLGLNEAKLAQWGFTSFSQMVKLADALVAVWSGAYSVLPQLLETKEARDKDLSFSANEAIAAPYIIRLR